jgi:hypothetical protein
MKVDISRFVLMASIAALLMVGGSTAAWAACPTSPNFTPDFGVNQDCLVLNGTNPGLPAFVSSNPTVLRLTDDATFHVSGSAWFGTQQPVSKGFSTTFQFQITHTQLVEGPSGPADGIAFVIQNSSGDGFGTAARGGSGGAIGYGVPDGGDNGVAIPDSLAIEFDTYPNSWDPDANHVAVQSCGIGPNSQDHTNTSCKLGLVPSAQLGTTLAAGIHTVTITYVPPSCTDCSGTLDVILDNKDLFPTPVSVTLDSKLNLNNGAAWVGFTGSTGGSVESNDIVSWTFTPQAQSGVATIDTPAILNFNGGTGNNNTGYDYNTQLLTHTGGLTSTTVQVQPILISEEDCEKLVDANPAFGHAQCFVFENADGKGTRSAVLYELTCPDLSGGSCDQSNFFAALGADFVFQKADNQGFQLLNSTIGPYAGWLKGDGGVPGHPCQVDPNNPNTPLFHSNQIASFSVTGDPTGITKGRGTPGGSCWVATYATGGEAPPRVKITAPTFSTYKQSATPGVASYTCSDPKTSQNPATSPVGPYLTAASCKQSQTPNLNNSSCGSSNSNGVISCSGTFDLSLKGLHLFTVTSKDSGGNVGANIVIYNVTK